MPSINNDENIVHPKMSENFHDENNRELSDCVSSLDYFDRDRIASEEIEAGRDQETNAHDHMYASFADEVSSSDANCQTAESEVRALKEWLLLHSDLIQQQNDDILDRERQIFILQKENEMLKERLTCLEKGIPYEPEKTFETNEEIPEDMTQDSNPCGDDDKGNIELVDLQHCDDAVTCSLEVLSRLSDSESRADTTVDEESRLKSENYVKNEEYTFKRDTETAEYNFTVDNLNFSECDPMKNIRMSIRRKRVCSNSSALSNNEPVALDEKKPYGRFKKKRKRIPKDTKLWTSLDPYVTQSNEVNLGIPFPDHEFLEGASDTNLEVPRWRVKHYSSCYTMEGTENLDDDVFNRRHLRLEIDERRRKRWDVQRIREQKVIEKLKQRQERVGSGSKGEEQQESLDSLWPKLDDVKYVEVNDELPVSAFGCRVPKIPASEFVLPWLNNPAVLNRKPQQSRRSTLRRKNSKNRR